MIQPGDAQNLSVPSGWGRERTVSVRTGFLLVRSALQVLGGKESGSLQDGQGEDGGVAHALGVGVRWVPGGVLGRGWATLNLTTGLMRRLFFFSTAFSSSKSKVSSLPADSPVRTLRRGVSGVLT